MILTFECFRAHAAHIFSFIAVSQFMLSQCRCIAENFAANLSPANQPKWMKKRKMLALKSIIFL